MNDALAHTLKNVCAALSICAAVFASATLLAQNPSGDLISEYEFVTGEIDNSQESTLFPAKVAVPGILWGTREGYRDGMVQLKLSCGVNDRRMLENAEGDEEEAYVALFRAELYRFNDGDWEYAGWYRLPGLPPRNACMALRQAAAVATPERPLKIKLSIQSQGTQHPNKIIDWRFAE